MADNRHAPCVEASIPGQFMGDGDAARANGLPREEFRLADDKQKIFRWPWSDPNFCFKSTLRSWLGVEPSEEEEACFFERGRRDLPCTAAKEVQILNFATPPLFSDARGGHKVLEAVVTPRRDKAGALNLLKRIMKKYGVPRSIVTDGEASGIFGGDERYRCCRRAGTRLAIGSTIAQRIGISRFGDANGRCSAFEVRKRCRNSAQFMPRCTTNSIRSAISSRGKSTSRDALLSWPNGALSQHRSPLARCGRAPSRRAPVTLTPPSRACSRKARNDPPAAHTPTRVSDRESRARRSRRSDAACCGTRARCREKTARPCGNIAIPGRKTSRSGGAWLFLKSRVRKRFRCGGAAPG